MTYLSLFILSVFPLSYISLRVSLIINLSVASHLYSPRKLSVLCQSFVRPPSTRNKKFIFPSNNDILDIPIFQDHCLRMLNCPVFSLLQMLIFRSIYCLIKVIYTFCLRSFKKLRFLSLMHRIFLILFGIQ